MDGRVEPHTTDGDLEGLDESQRAEVHEYEGGGPTDGLVLTDMARDRGEDFVEDDRRDEITPDAVDLAGMTILSADGVEESSETDEDLEDFDDVDEA